ncbi:hypothetical protein INR75_06690 [Zunongwangia sp. SCSIO 43204]|uniref:hypothetical protein n=1 Tax=Zunongwangia sp. SCSIO 43204 TaxID=2779359 RepID=UPI001CA8FD76|nr:hypothetical protein [Zunongwangia sp. SCSIO 43204]UAB85696.1 hypothetical protein INR75_06690 [Zunongwangia sp. SCSIO 43204]
MFNLDHITVLELFNLKDENKVKAYMNLEAAFDKNRIHLHADFVNRKPSQLGLLSYGQVASLKKYFANPKYETIYKAFDMVFKVKQSTFNGADVVDFLYSLRWLKQEINKIVEREIKMFAGDLDPVLEEAGINRLTMFGELNSLKELGKQFGIRPKEIADWSYNEVFSLLLHDKVQAEVQKRYNELKYGTTNQA